MIKKTVVVMMAAVLLVSGSMQQTSASAAMAGLDGISIQSIYDAKTTAVLSIYQYQQPEWQQSR